MLLVSHDREFMDNVVTSLLVMEGNGGRRTRRQLQRLAGPGWAPGGGGKSIKPRPSARRRPRSATPHLAPVKEQARLSYKGAAGAGGALPGRIDQLEQQQQALGAAMAEPDFYQQDHARILVSEQPDGPAGRSWKRRSSAGLELEGRWPPEHGGHGLREVVDIAPVDWPRLMREESSMQTLNSPRSAAPAPVLRPRKRTCRSRAR